MIKPLKQTDYIVVKQLFYDIFDMSEDPYFIAAWRNRMPDASLGYWVADVLVGAAIVSKHRLQYIYMHPEYRGNGTGTRLLQAVLKQTPNLHLTPVDDATVIQWYVKNGFHMVYQEPTSTGMYRIYVRHTHNTRHRSNNPRKQ